MTGTLTPEVAGLTDRGIVRVPTSTTARSATWPSCSKTSAAVPDRSRRPDDEPAQDIEKGGKSWASA